MGTYKNIREDLDQYKDKANLDKLNKEVVLQTEADLILREARLLGGKTLTLQQRKNFYVDYAVWNHKYVSLS
ncbi:MAG: hypothetical protein H6765_06180 [Candidatus Peribacteria bacterium]|nr:MAG: hypothetical protein H6765_06180 [Candidatus Peribacteria bacterium]